MMPGWCGAHPSAVHGLPRLGLRGKLPGKFVGDYLQEWLWADPKTLSAWSKVSLRWQMARTFSRDDLNVKIIVADARKRMGKK